MTPVSYLETGVIYCDDNLHRLLEFPAECVDLIYLDPPFFSNRQYEVIWGDEAEVRSFEDRWEGGIHVYVNWMRERMIELHRVLKPTGSIYLHCDWHASHYLKVMMDDVFGEANFQNEVVWYYRALASHPNAGLAGMTSCSGTQRARSGTSIPIPCATSTPRRPRSGSRTT
jgi:DNA modification methylase